MYLPRRHILNIPYMFRYRVVLREYFFTISLIRYFIYLYKSYFISILRILNIQCIIRFRIFKGSILESYWFKFVIACIKIDSFFYKLHIQIKVFVLFHFPLGGAKVIFFCVSKKLYQISENWNIRSSHKK